MKSYSQALKILKENAESQVALGDAQRRSNEIVNLTTKATQELGNQFKNILGDIPLIGGFLGDKVGGALMDLGATLKKNVVQKQKYKILYNHNFSIYFYIFLISFSF